MQNPCTSYNNCGCRDIIANTSFKFTYDEPRCYAPKVIIDCNAGQDCVIDCDTYGECEDDLIDATLAIIEEPQIEIEDLMKLLPAPDFPTGGIILGQSGSRQAYLSGKGSIVIRAKHFLEEQKKDRISLVITEIPYQEISPR